MADRRGCPCLAVSSEDGSAIDLTEADSSWNGETADDRAGISVAWAGEVNPANGVDARPCLGLVVGAHTAMARAEEAGAAYRLCDAPAETHSLGEATARLLAETAGDHAGISVAGPGDVTGDGDGDGALDLLTSAYAVDYRGALAAWRGPLTGERTVDQADAVITGEQPHDGAGGSDAAEDIEGDGLDDIGTAAQGHSAAGDRYGAAYVVLAPTRGDISLEDADWKLVGACSGGASQFRVAPGRDLDGDGLGEFLIGEEAPGPTRGASADRSATSTPTQAARPRRAT